MYRPLLCSSIKAHSLVVLLNPRFKFFMAAREPAMVSLIFSPAAAALDRADAPLPPPNLHDKAQICPLTW